MAFIYFVLGDTKDLINVPVNVESEDSILEQLGTNQMTSYAEQLPLAGVNLTTARQATNQYVASLYMARKQNFESARYWEDRYKETFNTLVNILTADPTSRTKRVAVSKEYITDPLNSNPKGPYGT